MYASCAMACAASADTALPIERNIEAFVIEVQGSSPFFHVDAEVGRGILMHAMLAAPVVRQPGAHALLRLGAQFTMGDAIDLPDGLDRVAHQRAELHIDEAWIVRRAIPIDASQ